MFSPDIRCIRHLEIHHERTSIIIPLLPSFGIYTENMIEEVNRVVGKGIVSNMVGVKANTKVVWADYGYDGITLFISFLKLSKASKIARVAEATGKIGGALAILNKITEIPNIPKNIFLELITNL